MTTVAAYLSPSMRCGIVECIPTERVLFATDWTELDRLLELASVGAAVIDPRADGTMNLSAARSVVCRHQFTPVIACISATPENLKAVAFLAKYGLSQVVLYPFRENREPLIELVHRLSANQVCYQFVGLIEARLGSLTPDLLQMVQDVFERPRRYENAEDLHLGSGVSTRTMYRVFQQAGLGTPKKNRGCSEDT